MLRVALPYLMGDADTEANQLGLLNLHRLAKPASKSGPDK